MTLRHLVRHLITTLLCGIPLLGVTAPDELAAQTGGETGIAVDTTFTLDSNDYFADPYTPSGSGFEPFIDSVFFDGRMIRLAVRVADEVRRDTIRLRALIDSVERAGAAVLAANLRLDPDEWRPTKSDIENREDMLRRSQDFEYIYPQNITRIPLAKIPLSSSGQALGLEEDVSPRISYKLTATRNVTVIVYTLDALEITRLVNGSQRPGEYRFDWDFLDANGRKVLPGSYIVEVIADETEKLLRKRIVVP